MTWDTKCQSTLYTQNTTTEAVCPFCSTTNRFQGTRLSKIGNAPNDLRMTLNIYLTCQTYPVYTEYVPPRPKFWSVSLYGQLILRHKVVENWKCIEWPLSDLEQLSKHPAYFEYFPPRARISLRFALRWLLFRIITFLVSLYVTRVNLKFWGKSLNLEIKLSNPTQYFCDDNWE